jgi:glycosyltransferase involved in cell wall biosynthesis
MTAAEPRRLLVVTTHYPYGSIEENWIEHELDVFVERFSEVNLLPVKELAVKRPLRNGINLWKPIASRNRAAFFAKQGLRPATWRHFFKAMQDCTRNSNPTVARTILCYKFACYRSAFERNEQLNGFLTSTDKKSVYCYWGHLPSLAIPLARSKMAGTCVRYHASDLYIHRPEVGGFYPWRQELWKTTDLSVFISDHGCSYFHGLARERNLGRSKVLRLGSRDFGPPRQRIETGEQSPITIVSASWIMPIKRVEMIARLAIELSQQRPTIWHHFGSGMSKELDRVLAEERGLGLQIILHGQVRCDELQRFYREHAVTLFVNLSRDEGIPVSIMEALNADIPVVATAVGGTSEVVIDGRSGILVEPIECANLQRLASRIIAELRPGGALALVHSRAVWEERCNGRSNAEILTDELIALAR